MPKTFTANGAQTLIGPRADVLLRDLHTVFASGTWNDGTLTVEVSYDGATWFPTDAALTADGFRTVLGRFMAVRGNMTGATSPNVIVEAL